MSQAPASPLRGRHLLLGVSGSIAAYKAAPLVRLLTKAGAEVQVLMTPSAEQFISPLTLGTLSGREVLVGVFPENTPAEDAGWTRHVDLGLWADLFIIAPATAQTIAKLANGFCDSMLTATALSARCPLLICPAMDHDMYGHPATQANLKQLQDHGHTVLPAEHGELASGLIGEGRLPEPENIVDFARQMLSGVKTEDALPAPPPGHATVLHKRKVLVTAGPTREPIDPVRHLSNPSSGRMGFALAEAAASYGAEVVLVSGPSPLETPAGVHRIDVETADDMYQACLQHADADLVCMAAAVSDYKPASTATSKMKKGKKAVTIRLERTPDILAELGRRKRPDQYLLGFALETDNAEQYAREKLRKKNLDWIALNEASTSNPAFESETNQIRLIGRDVSTRELPVNTKRALAGELLSHICADISAAQTVESDA